MKIDAHTEKCFRILIKSTWNQIVFTILRLIWIQTDVCLDPDQSENVKYNLISGWFNKTSERFVCVYNTCFPRPLLPTIDRLRMPYIMADLTFIDDLTFICFPVLWWQVVLIETCKQCYLLSWVLRRRICNCLIGIFFSGRCCVLLVGCCAKATLPK